MPAHARAADDGLYRAVDTYLKVSVHRSRAMDTIIYNYVTISLCLVMIMFS